MWKMSFKFTGIWYKCSYIHVFFPLSDHMSPLTADMITIPIMKQMNQNIKMPQGHVPLVHGTILDFGHGTMNMPITHQVF